MINENEHLCIVARVPGCGCVIQCYLYRSNHSLLFIKQFLNDATANNLHVEISVHNHHVNELSCTHQGLYYNSTHLPSAEAIRRADEVYKAVQVMRELQ